MNAKVTAIVPTYNRAELLGESVQSICVQTRMVNEVIIWDDGSTDNTSVVAQHLGEIMSTAADSASKLKVHYFKSENGGKSRALNLALEKATGDYIWICDDDDLCMPDAMEKLAALLDEHPNAVAAGGCYRRFSTDTQTGERVEQGPGYWPDLSIGTPLRHLLEDIFLFQNATLVRKSAFVSVGPFREDLNRSIDYDMVVRLACAGPVLLIEDTIFLQRKHDGDRGPAHARHAAKKSDDAWKIADKEVFAPYRERIPLVIYEAMYAADDPDLVRRAALLQRACVYARRTDWVTAAADFAAAADVLPSKGLSATEELICKRALAGKHGVAEAIAPQMCARISRIAASSPAGASIAQALARGVNWRIKSALKGKRWSEVFALGWFVAALARPRLGQTKPTVPEQVTERATYPQEGYRII